MDCSCGPQLADVGCLGNRLSLQVRATIVAGQAVTHGELGSLSRALKESRTKVILEKGVFVRSLLNVSYLCNVYVRNCIK